MISILIPTFNYNVFPLASAIEKLLLEAKVDFEIICFDDGSKSTLKNVKNEKINTLSNSKFKSLEKNIGLSNNRNALASESIYEYLLFIDGDSLLLDKYFIKRYIENINDTTEIIYGGRVHPETVEAQRKLRWKYGIVHEDLKAIQRNKNKYKSVLFNNTLIKKKCFEKIGFEQTITQYGHEDTVFSYHLKKLNTYIQHIDNPVLHGDVDLNDVFFNKMHKSIENLNSIYKTKLVEPDFITFLKFFNKLKRFKLNYLFALNYKIFRFIFKQNLTSKTPSIYLFDLFRISYFCHINLKK